MAHLRRRDVGVPAVYGTRVDTIEVTVFPVISGTTGVDRIFDGADDFDLELLEARTFGHTQVLTYRPTRHS
jgi:hypothetical protein